MAANPIFPLYFNDMDRSTKTWTDSEYGTFMRLLVHQWAQGWLPTDPDRLARITPGAAKHWDVIGPKFKEVEPGKLQNERLEEIREEQQAFKDSQREKGKKGGNPNFKKGAPNPYNKPKDNPDDNPEHNPPDNPDDKPKDKPSISSSTSSSITNSDSPSKKEGGWWILSPEVEKHLESMDSEAAITARAYISADVSRDYLWNDCKIAYAGSSMQCNDITHGSLFDNLRELRPLAAAWLKEAAKSGQKLSSPENFFRPWEGVHGFTKTIRRSTAKKEPEPEKPKGRHIPK